MVIKSIVSSPRSPAVTVIIGIIAKFRRVVISKTKIIKINRNKKKDIALTWCNENNRWLEKKTGKKFDVCVSKKIKYKKVNSMMTKKIRAGGCGRAK